ncbi:MAG: hypothetical protein HRU19_25225 [Pseudobacteriovorax sp.]|nr:hypothetical protein [Pseudobacteriovorax sp.]
MTFSKGHSIRGLELISSTISTYIVLGDSYPDHEYGKFWKYEIDALIKTVRGYNNSSNGPSNFTSEILKNTLQFHFTDDDERELIMGSVIARDCDPKQIDWTKAQESMNQFIRAVLE